MHTLTELDPKVGEVVVYSGKEYAVKYKSEHQSYVLQPLSSAHWKEWWVVRDNYYAQSRQWTLKPKEQPVEDFKVGDRVTDGQRQGAVSATYLYAKDTLTVLWDWGKHEEVHKADTTLTKLPKPEPTLAELGLKVGDPVLNTRNSRCALVYAVCDHYVNLRYHCGDTLTLLQTDPISRLKKLEVPK